MKDAKRIVRATNFFVGICLPFRIDFYKRGREGHLGQNSILLLQDNGDLNIFGNSPKELKDVWSVSIRRYKNGVGGYYERINENLTKEMGLNLVKEIISNQEKYYK